MSKKLKSFPPGESDSSKDRKIFFLLWGSSILVTWAALPYALALNPQIAGYFNPALIIAQTVQSAILFGLAIKIGLSLARRLGFGTPVLDAYFGGRDPRKAFSAISRTSVFMGVLTAVLIILFSFLTSDISAQFLKSEIGIPTWMTLLVSFYGGIGEEILMRLFLMSLVVWITYKIRKTKDGKPTATGIWVSIILTSVIFGLGHLPITASVMAITPAVVFRAILLNGVGGVIFGWLYKKYGLESAILSHFTADICLHVVTPLVASVIL